MSEKTEGCRLKAVGKNHRACLLTPSPPVGEGGGEGFFTGMSLAHVHGQYSCAAPRTPNFSHKGRGGGHWDRSARGSSLVAALFLIVVVAALGAFAVRIGASQQQTVNLALLSARALTAANSGIEFGAYQALNAASCVSATLNLTEAGANGFTVDVTCSASAHAESGGTVDVYRIDATAVAGTYGMPDYVSRHVYATFASAP